MIQSFWDGDEDWEEKICPKFASRLSSPPFLAIRVFSKNIALLLYEFCNDDDFVLINIDGYLLRRQVNKLECLLEDEHLIDNLLERGIDDFNIFQLLQPHTDSNDKNPSSFEFLKHLQGCKKGDKVKGITKLKGYLKQFGYLSRNGSNNEFKAIAAPDDDDDFDEVMVSAINAYQQNYNLEVTGTLDAKTLSKMMMPRCGMPDSNIKKTGSRHREIQEPGRQGFIHESSHYAFFNGNLTWPPSKTQLTYAFPSGTNSDARQSFSQAFQKWASVSRFTFTSIEDFANADIKISFQAYDHGDGSPFDGPRGVLAHAFPPTDGRLHLDASEKWAVGAVPGAFDIGTVGLHEIGHILGLQHSTSEKAIMYPMIGPGGTKGLSSDDIEGIKALYQE
ncbi:unnamed protein product [Dovyalis caffra]|uniref:Peptidase metallopeptidase domain-containing protein n=1 Tax=Dovyalis caffra TaxID=77055 RepID=A0AAV1RU64_9ROSI|nr:unnamed protein product [Dovyalis caffra]